VLQESDPRRPIFNPTSDRFRIHMLCCYLKMLNIGAVKFNKFFQCVNPGCCINYLTFGWLYNSIKFLVVKYFTGIICAKQKYFSYTPYQLAPFLLS